MGHPAFAALPATDTLSWEMTQLPDLDLYREDVVLHAFVDRGEPLISSNALERLAGHYPELRKSDLAFGIVAAYVARLSENSEAVFPIQDNRTPASHGSYVPLSITLDCDETFENFLSRVLLARTSVCMNSQSRWEYSHDAQMPLAISFGGNSKPFKPADIWINCLDDGRTTWRHDTSVNPRALSLMSARMTAMAQGIAADPRKRLVEQPIMDKSERDLVLQQWNDTSRNYGFDGGLVAALERNAAENPDHPACIFMDEELSFAEFNARANRLARVLREKGVGRDTFVGLCLDRSHELVIALWATLKAGGAYVPLNTQDPVGRIQEIVDDCQPKVVLTQEHLTGQVEGISAEVMVLPEGGDIDPRADGSDLGIEVAPDSLAYMIYTSGSTGKPKGVIVEHEAIHNRVVWMHEQYGLRPEDRVLQKTPYTFDVSVWEFLWSFSVGSTLVVAEPNGHMVIGYLYRLIQDRKITHLHFVPSVLRMFLAAPKLDELSIKKLFCSGEALGYDVVSDYYAKANEEAEVHNLYGPTEAAVDVSYFHCPRENPAKLIPIGKPVTNTSLQILDENDQPCPVGVPGELHIGGVQLARGYWARENLTQERFVSNPVQDAPHDRLYKTGDLARYMPDGDIVYMGRNDFQVKINGVRMELGEIEAAIREQDGVKDVVVVAEENAGNKILIAYVVANEPSEEKSEQLKAGVGAVCPVFYIPKEIRFLSQMPLSTAGKIDRKVLADLPRI
ncbi:MAG: non-ribosomal peptide synthetase [Rhizobiaceae bacterium]